VQLKDVTNQNYLKVKEFKLIELLYYEFTTQFTPCFLVKNIHLFLGAFATLRKETVSYLKIVRPHGTTRLPLDGFL
jgi:hypothetical protein